MQKLVNLSNFEIFANVLIFKGKLLQNSCLKKSPKFINCNITFKLNNIINLFKVKNDFCSFNYKFDDQTTP